MADFQHTAALRRLDTILKAHDVIFSVSTHSRPKAAGRHEGFLSLLDVVSTHSRPKAAGIEEAMQYSDPQVSTHSRPKAAGLQ